MWYNMWTKGRDIMSRVIVEVGKIKSVILYSNDTCDIQRHDDFITIDSNSVRLRILGCVSSWYMTNRLKVTDGDYVKLVRRYPAWLYCLALILLTLMSVYFKQPALKIVLMLVLAIGLDKYIAYTLCKVVITFAMT